MLSVNVEVQRRPVEKSPNMTVKTDRGIGEVFPASPPRAAAAHLQR